MFLYFWDVPLTSRRMVSCHPKEYWRIKKVKCRLFLTDDKSMKGQVSCSLRVRNTERRDTGIGVILELDICMYVWVGGGVSVWEREIYSLTYCAMHANRGGAWGMAELGRKDKIIAKVVFNLMKWKKLELQRVHAPSVAEIKPVLPAHLHNNVINPTRRRKIKK